MSFRRNNLKYILWKKTIVNNKVPKIKQQTKKDTERRVTQKPEAYLVNNSTKQTHF